MQERGQQRAGAAADVDDALRAAEVVHVEDGGADVPDVIRHRGIEHLRPLGLLCEMLEDRRTEDVLVGRLTGA